MWQPFIDSSGWSKHNYLWLPAVLNFFFGKMYCKYRLIEVYVALTFFTMHFSTTALAFLLLLRAYELAAMKLLLVLCHYVDTIFVGLISLFLDVFSSLESYFYSFLNVLCHISCQIFYLPMWPLLYPFFDVLQEKKLLLERNGPHIARISVFEVSNKL